MYTGACECSACQYIRQTEADKEVKYSPCRECTRLIPCDPSVKSHNVICSSCRLKQEKRKE